MWGIKIIGIAISIIITCGVTGILTNHERNKQEPKEGWDTRQIVDFSNDPWYAPVPKYLRVLVKTEDRVDTRNTFCVTWYYFPGNPDVPDDRGLNFAWVYWIQRGEILRWDPWRNVPGDGLLWPSEDYYLLKNVVATDTQGAANLTTIGFVADVLRDCSTKGHMYEL